MYPAMNSAAAQPVVTGPQAAGRPVLPSCSVIIPSYNSAKFIDVALVSLLEQTRKPDQVVIVDANSTDGTGALVDSFRDRLSIDFLNAPRSSMGVARNIGIRAATGDIICFLDTDDIFLKDHIEQACALLAAEPNTDAVHGYPVQWNSFTDRLETAYDWFHDIDHEMEIFESSLINLSTLSVRRRFLEEHGVMFSEGLQGRYCEDWDFCLRLIAAGMHVRYLQTPMSVVTERAGSHTRKSIFGKMRFCLLRSLQKHRPAILGRRNDAAAQLRVAAAINTQIFKTMLTMLASGRPRTAAKLGRRLQNPKYRAIAGLLTSAAQLLPAFDQLARAGVEWGGGYGRLRPRRPASIGNEPALDYLRQRLRMRSEAVENNTEKTS